MRFALIGSVSSSEYALRGLLAGGAEIVAVCGLDPLVSAAVSDYRNLGELAAQHALPYLPFRKVSEPAVTDFLKQARPDLIFVIGLSQLIPDQMFDLARIGLVGFHPTPLPEGRGRAPVAWTLLLNRPAAANLFWLTADADAGDLLEQRPVEVRPADYAQDLIERTNQILADMTRDLVPRLLRGELPRQPQEHARATWYGRRGPEDGAIDWHAPAEQVLRLIRAASRPYPGAFTWFTGTGTGGTPQRVQVWRATPHERNDHVGTPGQILRSDPACGVLVQCGRATGPDAGLLWLTELTDAAGGVIPQSGLRVGQKFVSADSARLAALEARLATLEARLAAP